MLCGPISFLYSWMSELWVQLCELLGGGNGVSSLQKQDKQIISSFLVTYWARITHSRPFCLTLNKGWALECDLYLVSNKEQALEYEVFGAP